MFWMHVSLASSSSTRLGELGVEEILSWPQLQQKLCPIGFPALHARQCQLVSLSRPILDTSPHLAHGAMSGAGFARLPPQ
jgi:hypothetical protein